MYEDNIFNDESGGGAPVKDTAFTEDVDFTYNDEDRTNQEYVSDAITRTVDKITSVPEWFEAMSKETNDKIIEWSRTLDKATDKAGKEAKKNVIGTKVTSYFTMFGRWIQEPRNMAIVGGVLFVIWYFKK